MDVKDYYGGPSRRAEVLYCIGKAGTAYLRSVKPLAKREFEELFGFGSGYFEAGRVIAVPSAAIAVV